MAWLLQALQPIFAAPFAIGGAPVSWLEIVAFGLSLAMVACNIRVDPRGWPLAIVSSLLYFLLFWNSRLYGDAGLQLFFVVVAFWGWRQWRRGSRGDGPALQVRALRPAQRGRVLAAVAVAWPVTGAVLLASTDTDVPWWDAFPTAASVVGQWLLGRKYVENWIVWGVVNAVSIALFAYKGLWLTVLLYALFLALSWVGWRAWRRLLPAAPPAA